MIITIVIVAYLTNVFLNRWLNKVAYKRNCSEIESWAWFIPIAFLIAMLIIISGKTEIKRNWFTGKNWNNERD
jgi:hypothetical protein